MAQFLTDTQINSVYELYIGYFNRAPEAGGLNYWSNYYLGQVNAGKTDAAIQKDIANQFYSAAVQYNIYSAGTPVEDFIKASYLNALGRDSVDPAGNTYWKAKLESGEVSRGEFVQKLVSDAKGFANDATYGWVSKYLDNRMAVAKAFAAANTTTGDAAITAGKAALSAVTPAAVQAGQSTTEALAAAGFGGTSNAGNTFTLTNGVDIATSNVFNARKGWTPGGTDQVNTLNDDDILTGTGTNPTLNFTFVNDADTGDMAIHPTLNGIETVKVAFDAGVVSTLDLQDSTGLKALEITRMDDIGGGVLGAAMAAPSYGVLNMTSVPSTILVKNSSQNQGDRLDFTFTGSAVNGAADETTLTLSNVNLHTLTLDDGAGTANLGVEKINLVSSGSANTINSFLSIEDTETLVITGDQNLTIGGQANANGSLKTVDASALEGNLTFTVSAPAAVGGAASIGLMNTTPDGATQGTVAFSLKSGKGADSLRINEQVNTNDSIDAGEGTDTLRAQSNGSALYDVIQVNAAGNNVTGVENVQLWRTGAATVVADELTLRADEAVGDQTIEVRNHAGSTALGTNVVEATKYNLMNLTAAEATQVSIAHSGNTQLANPAVAADSLAANQLNIDVNGATAAKVAIVDGVNADDRFNFQLYTDSDLTVSATGVQAGTAASGFNNATNTVISLTIADTDTESNTVALMAAGSVNGAALVDTGTAYMGTGSSVTLTNGVAGQFLNLDSNGDQGYNLDMAGTSTADAIDALVAAATADSAVQAATATAAQEYWFLDDGATVAAATTRVIAENVDASTLNSDLIIRLGDTTRANGVSSQSITGGAGRDTFIFDAQGVKNSGYTSGDTVKGSAGLDTLVIDGNTAAAKLDGTAGVTGNVSVQKSEWDNTSGIDVLRLAGNQGVANVGNGAIVGSANNLGGYYVEIDNEFVKQTDAGNGLVIISNDGNYATNFESDLILNLRPLSQTSNVTFIGANSNNTGVAGVAIAGNASNRIQLEDNSANGANILDGGDTLRDSQEFGVAGVTRTSSGNNNVLEVFNTADVSINDLSNTKNFGRIEGTNDLAVAQTLKLVLNDTVMDQLVDAGTAARIAAAGGVTANIERLVVVANNNANVAGAVENLNIDASAVTNKFGLDVIVDRGTTNTIVGTAGADKVVIKGNFTTAEQAADGHTAVVLFAGANALTGTALTTAIAANGTAYKGVDGVAGTADDVLLAYNGTFTNIETIETFGGVDLTGATISAGTAIVAHSAVRLTAEQFNALTSITFVGGGAHGLQIVNNTTTNAEVAPNLSKVTLSGAGTTVTYTTGTEVPAATGTATLSSGATTQPTNGGTTTGTNGGTSTGGTGGTTTTAGYTLTAGIDTFNNSAVGTLAASFAGVAGTTPTVNSNATIATTVANYSTLDTLTFGTGSDTLQITDALAAGSNLVSAGTQLLGVAVNVTGLDAIQLANVVNNTTINADYGSKLTVTGGSAQDLITIAGATTGGLTLNTGAGVDVVAAGAGNYLASSTVNLGDGDDEITVKNATDLAAGAATIEGGAGTDTIKVTDGVTLTDANFATISGVEKLTFLGSGNTSVTSGGFFNTNFANGVTITAGAIANGATATVDLGLYNKAATVSVTSGADGATSADNIAVTTGSGNDNVTVVASSWVGHATTGGAITISTGDGNDTIAVTTGTILATGGVVITGGKGADTITATTLHADTSGVGVTYKIVDGDSLAASRDKITGFDLGTAAKLADSLDLDSTNVTGNTTGTNGSDLGTIKSHAIASGIITFDDVDTFATALVINATNLSDVLGYLAANISVAGDTVAFAYDSDASGTADSTIVFQQGASDTVVELVGVVGTSITGTNAATAGLIDLA